MDRLNHIWYKLSLRKSLILYITCFALLAFLLSSLTISLLHYLVNTIQTSYPSSGERYYLTTKQGKQLGEGILISKEPIALSQKDQYLITLLNGLSLVIAPLYSVLCMIIAVCLFYQTKLKEPFETLKQASEKITQSDLSFSIDYHAKDELGQLCASFEIMRTTLEANFEKMWRQIEERKQLNATFAHELRTPLTVLKGYNEMLQLSDITQTREIAQTMGKQIIRMETYIQSMSQLKRLEDTEPQYKLILLEPFLHTLFENAKIMSQQNEKNILFQNKTSSHYLSIDPDFISQVCDNLVSNAMRYANETITLTFTEQENGLCLTVIDDGIGFDNAMLSQAVQPYKTSEKIKDKHFGLGLYICKILCERHEGYLQIETIPQGAKVIAFFKVYR